MAPASTANELNENAAGTEERSWYNFIVYILAWLVRDDRAVVNKVVALHTGDAIELVAS